MVALARSLGVWTETGPPCRKERRRTGVDGGKSLYLEIAVMVEVPPGLAIVVVGMQPICLGGVGEKEMSKIIQAIRQDACFPLGLVDCLIVALVLVGVHNRARSQKRRVVCRCRGSRNCVIVKNA